jgi:hypothetical protein
LGKSSSPAPVERRPSALPVADPDAPATVANSAKVVAWGVGFWGAVQLAGAVFETRAVATLVAQAAIAEWGASRVGVAWTLERGGRDAPKGIGRGRVPPTDTVLGRVGVGAALGGGAAAVALVLGLAVHAASSFPTAPSISSLLLGLAIASLGAVRDELLLRGVVLRATKGLLPPWAALLSAGATAAAASFGYGAGPWLLVAEGLRGTALAGVWTRDRGAWMACAANAAWTWAFGAVTRGALVDLRFVGEPEASAPALAILAVAAAVAVGATFGRRQAAAA